MPPRKNKSADPKGDSSLKETTNMPKAAAKATKAKPARGEKKKKGEIFLPTLAERN